MKPFETIIAGKVAWHEGRKPGDRQSCIEEDDGEAWSTNTSLAA